MVFRHDDRGGVGALEVGLVAWIGQEGEIPLPRLADPGNAGNLDRTVSDDDTVDGLGDRVQRDLHSRPPTESCRAGKPETSALGRVRSLLGLNGAAGLAPARLAGL